MEEETRKLKRRLYMKMYRKRNYVKKRAHEYYIQRLIKESERDNEKYNQA